MKGWRIVLVIVSLIDVCRTFPTQDDDFMASNLYQYSYDADELLSNIKSYLEKNTLLSAYPQQTPQESRDTKSKDRDLLASLVYFLENIPVEECRELPEDNARLIMACIGNYIVRRNNHSSAKLLFGKRTEELKFQPTGWKRKRRDVNTPSQEELEEIIRHILQKRQKLRFNPTGW